MALSPGKLFADFFAHKGRKVTDQMLRVVEAVSECTGTFTHDDILIMISGRASRAMVFCTLARMLEAEMLRQVTFNGREVFVVTASGD